MNDTDALNSLPDEEIDLDYSLVSNICDLWKSKITGMNLNSEELTSSFSSLTRNGILTTTVSSVSISLENVLTSLSMLITEIKNNSEDQHNIDKSETSNDENINSTSENKNVTNSEIASTNTVSIASNIEKSNITTSVNNQKEEIIEIKNSIIDSIKNLEFNSYIEFMDSLASVVTVEISLTTYLKDSIYAEFLKKTLLESIIIPEKIKIQLQEIDAITLQKQLYEMVNDTSIVTDISKSVMYETLERIAKENNIIVSDITKNNKELLDAFMSFGKTSTILEELSESNELGNSLLKFYDGDSISTIEKDNAGTIRDIVNSLANDKSITVEELLSNSSNKEYLKERINEIGKAYKYITSIGYTDIDTVTNIFNNIFFTK